METKTNTPNSPNLDELFKAAQPAEVAKGEADPEASGITEVTPSEVFNTGTTAEASDAHVSPGAPADAFPGAGKPGNSGGGFSLPPRKGTTLGKVLPGETAVTLLDTLLPSLIVLLIDQVGYKADKKGFQLTKDERSVVAPALTEYLNSINVDFDNPLHNLLFVLGIVYGSKAIDVLPNLKKKDPKQTADETVKAEPAKIADRLNAKQEKERARMVFIKELRDMNNRALAVQAIIDRKKLSKAGAEQWYNKYVA